MKKLIYTIVVLLIIHCTFNIENCQAQWVQMSNGMPIDQNIQSFASNPSYLFAGLKVDFTNTKGVYRSSNNGNGWDQTALTSYDIYSIATSGNYLFAGTNDNGIYRSTDNGTTFTQVSTITGDVCLAISGSYIFAGNTGATGGVYLSTNNGNSWTKTSLISYCVKCIAINGSYIFAGTKNCVGGYGVYRSTNNGTNWTLTSLNNQEIRSLAISGSNIFAGTQLNGVYLSTNNGNTWTQTSLNTEWITSLIISGTNIFAGTDNGNFFHSTDNGTTWIPRNEGLPTVRSIYSLLISNSYIFLGTGGNSVWRRPTSEIIGIQNISTEIPSSFSLSQNYPNPFNPTTNIRFDLPRSGSVKLVVFDALGREVATLVNEKLAPGTYEVDWNGSEYPSGVYFYRIQAGDFVETKKMLLVM
ncbi:T9SS type A sorting domain-containing protein [Bacteroidota bacterium]